MHIFLKSFTNRDIVHFLKLQVIFGKNSNFKNLNYNSVYIFYKDFDITYI